MTDPEWTELKRTFDEVAALPAKERAGALDRLCRGRPDLRRSVEDLLAAHDADEGFSLGPDTLARTTGGSEPSAGETIDRYRLLQKIGEGGFGAVYMAEQTEPVQRRVALKVIKPGMDTKEVIARFEAERQALALMDHPNIAKVFDGGVTSEGRPYFVMELVHGIPIVEYCDRNDLRIEDRIRLLIDVCSAVQHAHQKGVIHRDLKPANVLVTLHDGVPVPKVIDFGIAKAIDRRLTERTLFTAYGRFVGTPEYMSPEQAEMSGLDVDTRSDVYSLGVLLYELLTGSTPHRGETLRQLALAEMLAVIREGEPERPSTRVSASGERTAEIAKRHGVTIGELARSLRGELDWIVMRCLEKDRTRRYDTARDLGRDLQRHLDHEPVEAAAPSFWYRAGKTARRHRVLIGIVSIIVAATVVTGAALTYSLLESNRQRQATEQARAEAEAVRDFLKDLLKAADPNEQTNPDLTVREAVEQASDTVEERFRDHPLVKAEVWHTIGEMGMAMGVGDAKEAFRTAYAIRDSLLGPDDPATLASLQELAVIVEWSGEYDEGDRLHRRTVDTALRVFGPHDSTTCFALIAHGRSLARPGHLGEAESVLERARECVEAAEWGSEDERLDAESYLRNGLFFLYLLQGDVPKTAEVTRLDVEDAERRHGPLHPSTLAAKGNYGLTLAGLYRHDEAVSVLSEALEDAHRLYDPRSLRQWAIQKNLADALVASGDGAEAEKQYRDLLRLNEQSENPQAAREGACRFGLAAAIALQGRTEEAHRAMEELLVRANAWVDSTGIEEARALPLRAYSRVLIAMDSLAAAVPVLEETARISAKPENPLAGYQAPDALVSLCRVLDELGETDRAEIYRQQLPDYLESASREPLRTTGGAP